MLDGQIESLWNLHESLDGYPISYMVMTLWSYDEEDMPLHVHVVVYRWSESPQKLLAGWHNTKGAKTRIGNCEYGLAMEEGWIAWKAINNHTYRYDGGVFQEMKALDIWLG